MRRIRGLIWAHSMRKARGLIWAHSMRKTRGLISARSMRKTRGHAMRKARGLISGHSMRKARGLISGHSMRKARGLSGPFYEEGQGAYPGFIIWRPLAFWAAVAYAFCNFESAGISAAGLAKGLTSQQQLRTSPHKPCLTSARLQICPWRSAACAASRQLRPMIHRRKTALHLKKNWKFGGVRPAEAAAKSGGQPSSAAQQLAESQPSSAALPLVDPGLTSAAQGMRARSASSRRKNPGQRPALTGPILERSHGAHSMSGARGTFIGLNGANLREESRG